MIAAVIASARSCMTFATMRSTRRIISAAARREKGQQHDTTWIGAIDDEMSNAMGQGCWSSPSLHPRVIVGGEPES
jgi:hypothetical protein